MIRLSTKEKYLCSGGKLCVVRCDPVGSLGEDYTDYCYFGVSSHSECSRHAKFIKNFQWCFVQYYGQDTSSVRDAYEC